MSLTYNMLCNAPRLPWTGVLRTFLALVLRPLRTTQHCRARETLAGIPSQTNTGDKEGEKRRARHEAKETTIQIRLTAY